MLFTLTSASTWAGRGVVSATSDRSVTFSFELAVLQRNGCDVRTSDVSSFVSFAFGKFGMPYDWSYFTSIGAYRISRRMRHVATGALVLKWRGSSRKVMGEKKACMWLDGPVYAVNECMRLTIAKN